MTKSQVTKRALVFSVLSLLLCFSMLAGTTYAWFTDTVASTGNIIQSGILDAALVDANGNSLEGKPLSFEKAAGAPADEQVLWEPGCTYNLQDFKVKNVGNLAFKFKILITGIEGDYKLLEAIDWTVSFGDNNDALDLDAWHHLLPGETFPAESGMGVRIQGHMREDAGNEYQNLVAEGISIMIYAIQDTVEYDSFDNQYDALGQMPQARVMFFNGRPVDEDGNVGLQMFSADKESIIRQYVLSSDENFKDSLLDQNADFIALDAAYKFSTTETESPYANWNADFVVYADRDVPVRGVLLAGQYDTPLWGGISFPWIYLTNTDEVVTANTEIRLLSAYGIAANYEEVMAMRDFNCGIKDTSGGALDGATLTVELRLFKTEKINGSYTETDEYITVGKTTYTFGRDNFVTRLDDLNTMFVDGGNFVLLEDIVTNEKITVPTGKDVTLDLNGHTVAGAFSTAGTTALIENKGTLTVKNGSIVSLAECPDVDWAPEGFPTYASNTIANRGTLVIGEGAYIENQTNVGGASYAIDNYAGATLTVNGGIIRAKDHAIRLNTASATAENNVTINGGTIIGKRAIWVHLAGGSSAVAPKVNLTINGGELSSNVMDAQNGLVIYSYSYGNSFANTNITITGGQFLSGSVQFGGGYKGDSENVTITGGIFEQDVIRWVTADTSAVIYAKNK